MTQSAALALIDAVLGSLLVACDQGGPALTFPTAVHHLEVGVSKVQQGDSWSVGMEGTICLDKPGTVRITGVRLVHPHGLRIIGFGLRANPRWKPPVVGPNGFLGEDRAPLRQLGYTRRVVDVVCDPKVGAGYELAVRLVKTTTGEAGAAAWNVSYGSAEGTRTFVIPVAVKLCRDRSADAHACRRSPL